ncbi:putative GTP-binding protein rhoA [Infundibulicybe gibba]|nr:putative GTP-binding protein rhoA [Infundibulicybe gibba]
MKVVAVGNGAVGKTCLLASFARGQFPDEFIPTIFENYIAEHTLDGVTVEVSLWDTAGQEEYERLRLLSYDGAHVILICFAVDDQDSFNDVQEKWISEVIHHAPGVPILLVGCKQDLRDQREAIEYLQRVGQRFVTVEEATTAARGIGAKEYLECSARRGVGVAEVFSQATRAFWSSSSARKGSRTSKCVIF